MSATVPPRYDPLTQQPRNLGELERWCLANEASNRATLIPSPVNLGCPPIPGLECLANYYRVTYDQSLYSVESVRRLTAAYARKCNPYNDEAKAASWHVVAETLAPSGESDASHRDIEKADGGQPADPYLELRAFAEKELIGKERAVVEALCDSKGKLPIADLAIKKGVAWGDHKQGFKDAQRRLKPKLKAQGWRLNRQNNAACLKKIEARKRS